MEELLQKVREQITAMHPSRSMLETLLARIKKQHETAVIDAYDDGYAEGYGYGLADGEYEAGIEE